MHDAALKRRTSTVAQDAHTKRRRELQTFTPTSRNEGEKWGTPRRSLTSVYFEKVKFALPAPLV